MASGSIILTSNQPNYVSGRIDWQSYANTSGNFSLVNVQVYIILKSWGIQGTGAGQWKENGVTISNFSPYVNIPYGGNGTVQVFTKNDIKVNHNENGDGSITLGCDMQFNFAGISNIGGSQTINMDHIDRYAEFTKLNVDKTTMNTATITWNANATIDEVKYQVDGGEEIKGIYPTFVVENLIPNTTHKLKVKIKRASNQLWTSKEVNVTTKDIARIVEATSGDLENEQKVTFTNPSGNITNLYIRTLDDVLLVTRKNIKSPIELTFTNEEKELMHKNSITSNNLKINYVLETVEAKEYENKVERTLIITNATPLFNDFSYRDDDGFTTSLTGNNQKFIKGYSQLRTEVSVENKAIAQKSANMIKYRTENGTSNVEASYSSTNEVSMFINKIQNNIVFVKAIDSRGNIATVQKEVELIDYKDVLLKNLKIVRNGGIGTTATIIANGDFDNVNFGAVQNTITSILYRKKEIGGEFGEWTDITNLFEVDVENGTFENADVSEIAGFELGTEYIIEVLVNDRLSQSELEFTLNSGESIICFNKTKKVTGFGKIPDRTFPQGSGDFKGIVNSEQGFFVNGEPVGSEKREVVFEGQIKCSTSYTNISKLLEYKKAYVYIALGTDDGLVIELDIENPNDALNNACKNGVAYCSNDADSSGFSLITFCSIFYSKSTGNFRFTNCFTLTPATNKFTSWRGNAYRYVYKIEGVK